jgi:Bacterial Ig-like domain
VTVAADDSGTNGDGITDDATPAVAGTTEPEATVQLKNGAQVLGTATPDGNCRQYWRLRPRACHQRSGQGKGTKQEAA